LSYSNNILREYGEHEEHEEDHEDGDEDGDEDDDDHDDHEGAHLDMGLKTTSLDLKYSLPKLENLETIIGATILSQENKNHGEEMLIPDAEKMDVGIFGVWHYHLDNVDFVFGSRYDNREIKVGGNEYEYFGFVNSLGLKTSLGSSSTIRLNLSSGYRAPNLSELFSDGAHHGTSQYQIGSTSLEEEKNTQYDVSYEYRNNENFVLGIDVFYNNINDYIYLNPTGGVIDELPVYNYDQTDSKLFGGEIQLSYQTGIDWLSFDTSIEYLNGETSEGDYLPMISPLTFRQDFTIDISDNIFKLDFLYKGEQSNVSEFESTTDSYFTVNLSGSHKIGISENSLNVFWSVDNLLDAEYIDHMSRLKNLGIHEMGRNISVGLNYNF
jgi:iron complex outermembrane receptor protein